MIWPGYEVAKYVKQPPAVKVNPNGVDIGVSEVWRISQEGVVTIHGNVRKIEPAKEKVLPKGEYWILTRGVYEVRVANEIEIPKHAIGLLLPRSTFNRLGIIKAESAVWDSGYKGYGTQTILVWPREVKIHIGEKWFQLVFMDARDVKQLYEGYYQGERPEA